MSKLNIADLANEVTLSPAAMREIGGGISCEAGTIVADTYTGIAQILHILGDDAGAAGFYGRAAGVREGACGPA
jgi:hypothetical protein